MNKLLYIIMLSVLTIGSASAQVPDDYRQRREAALDSMRQAREQYVEDYWKRFRLFEAEHRPMRDKPPIQPLIDSDTTRIDLLFELQPPLTDTAKNATGTMSEYLPGRQHDISVLFYNLPSAFKVPDNTIDINLVSLTLAGQLATRGKAMQLNDWGLYQLAKRISDEVYPNQEKERMQLTVSLMNQMHYDVRMGKTEKGYLSLVRTNCTVYGLPYIELDGQRYYADGASNVGHIYCDERKATADVRPLDMRLSQTPRLNGERVRFSGKSIGVGSGLIDFFADYPSVDIRIPASAAVSEDMMRVLKKEVLNGIGTEDPVAALNRMLNFCQTSFKYQPDVEQFGAERYFFCEENFAYPANDCEDRAILFAHMVREYLGLDVVLLDYPDHITTAVCLPETQASGRYITLNSRRYYLCDPTFRGARVGQLDKRFHNKKAKVILTK